MTFKLNQKFNTSQKAEVSTSSMFNRDFAKDLSLNSTEEYKFDHNKIQAKLDNNLQEVIHLDYGNVGSQVMVNLLEILQKIEIQN